MGRSFSAWDLPGGWGAPAPSQSASSSAPTPLTAYGILFVALCRPPTESELLQAASVAQPTIASAVPQTAEAEEAEAAEELDQGPLSSISDASEPEAAPEAAEEALDGDCPAEGSPETFAPEAEYF